MVRCRHALVLMLTPLSIFSSLPVFIEAWWTLGHWHCPSASMQTVIVAALWCIDDDAPCLLSPWTDRVLSHLRSLLHRFRAQPRPIYGVARPPGIGPLASHFLSHVRTCALPAFFSRPGWLSLFSRAVDAPVKTLKCAPSASARPTALKRRTVPRRPSAPNACLEKCYALPQALMMTAGFR